MTGEVTLFLVSGDIFPAVFQWRLMAVEVIIVWQVGLRSDPTQTRGSGQLTSRHGT
ncbi:hypothetical protein Hanom_Chr11g01022461 [Helianthus anomalus]